MPVIGLSFPHYASSANWEKLGRPLRTVLKDVNIASFLVRFLVLLVLMDATTAFR